MNARDLRQKGYAIEVLLERGLERFRTGATTLALQMWEEALALDPDEPRALTYIDYCRQNWDEVDGCVDAPLPDVSDLQPNYAVEPEAALPPRVGNVQAPVSGQVDSHEVEARRVELAALEAQIAAARAELARATAAPPAPVAEAVPSVVPEVATPRGTVEYQPGGVAGDGWGLAGEALARQPDAFAALRPWTHGEPAAAVATVEPVAEAAASEAPEPVAEAAAGEGGAAVDEVEPLELGDEALEELADDGAAAGPSSQPSEEALTDPRILLPSEADADGMAEEATRTYPRSLAAAALAGLPAPERADAPAVGRTPTPVMLDRAPTPAPMAARTPTPIVAPGRTILGAPDGMLAVADADFERDLEAALGAADAEAATASPAGAEPAAVAGAVAAVDDAVPIALGDEGFDDDLDLDLPPPVLDVGLAEVAAGASPVAAAGAEARDVVGEPAVAEELAAAPSPGLAEPPPAVAASDPFADERPTVWSPPPTGTLLTMAERVEQAMRDSDPFGDDRVTTSWASPPAELVAASRRPDDEAAAALAEPSIFERVTALLPTQRDELPSEAPTPVPSAARLTVPMAASRPAVVIPAAPPPAAVPAAPPPAALPVATHEPEPASESALAADDAETSFADLELAPRSGVGLGAEPPVRLDVRELRSTIDDLGPLAPSTGRFVAAEPPADLLEGSDHAAAAAGAEEEPAPAVEPAAPESPAALDLDEAHEAAGAAADDEVMALDDEAMALDDEASPLDDEAMPLDDEAMPLDDDDLLAEADAEEPARARVPTLPLTPPAPGDEDAAMSRATTRDLRPSALAGATDGDAAPPATARTSTSEVALPRSASSEIRLPGPASAERAEIGTFDGPEAQTVTVLPPPLELAHALDAATPPPPAVELHDEDPFELPTAPVSPLADTPQPPAETAAGGPPPPAEAASGGPRAKTLEFLPSRGALFTPTTPAAAPAPAAPPPAGPDQVDTADLTPRFPPPHQDVAVPVAVTSALGPARDRVDTADLGAPQPSWAADSEASPAAEPTAAPGWQPPRLRPADAWAPIVPADDAIELPPPAAPANLRRGDEIWSRDEHLGGRLSPEVLRGLGLSPLAEPAPDEPTRNGWPTGRRPAVPLPESPATAPVHAGPDAAVEAQLDDLMPAPGAGDLSLDELELPSPRQPGGTRTPGEVLLRSSAPEALTAALAAELDRGAPASEGPDDRARRRITALLEKASAAARAGEHPLSIAAIDLALSEAPDSAVAQKLVHRSRDIILDCYTRYFGDLQRRPVPVGSLADLTSRAIDPRAAFLVSRMDGTLTYEEILDVAGMGRLEACRHLAQLLVRGIIRAS